jgi:hypothetical protein
MPTLSAHVPEDWPLMPLFEQKVNNEYRRKPGPYIRDVIERDLRDYERQELVRHGAMSDEAVPNAMSATIMVELTTRLCGELTAASIAEAMEGKDQRRELQRLLMDVALEHDARKLQQSKDVSAVEIQPSPVIHEGQSSALPQSEATSPERTAGSWRKHNPKRSDEKSA